VLSLEAFADREASNAYLRSAGAVETAEATYELLGSGCYEVVSDESPPRE
jgi:hypothetical protein